MAKSFRHKKSWPTIGPGKNLAIFLRSRLSDAVDASRVPFNPESTRLFETLLRLRFGNKSSQYITSSMFFGRQPLYHHLFRKCDAAWNPSPRPRCFPRPFLRKRSKRMESAAPLL